MPPVPKPTAQTEPTVHEPVPDDTGVIRTDRPHTPDEAAAMDAANRDTLIARRQRRFANKKAARLR
jgi:hypothetical protein